MVLTELVLGSIPPMWSKILSSTSQTYPDKMLMCSISGFEFDSYVQVGNCILAIGKALQIPLLMSNTSTVGSLSVYPPNTNINSSLFWKIWL